jgi:unsaturated rhamnogalacturonyl hydrolase
LTGLYYHGWDESRSQKWSDPVTGRSPSFWGRAMGWYMMALVDVIDILPKGHPQWKTLVGIFKKLSTALVKYRDPETKLWYQIVDESKRPGNYTETSASAMFAYAFAKGASSGYLEKEYFALADETFKGIVKEKVQVTKEGLVDLSGTCRSAGLGGDPYRDGSYNYYISEPVRTNDMKGIGPLLLAAIELENGTGGK